MVVTQIDSLDEFLNLSDLSPIHVKAIRAREAGFRAAAELPSPSVGVGTFSGLQTVINCKSDVFHAGRPNNNHGPPVALFNPITRKIRQFSTCPAIVFGLMGDMVEIGITIYTDGAYSDFVFSSGRMRLGYRQNAQVLRIARALKAVKLALVELDLFYEQLPNAVPNFNVQLLFPSPRPVPSWDGEMPAINFTHRMSRAGELFITPTSPENRQAGMYLGTMLQANSSASPDAAEEHIEVVIKFTSEYNEDAHRLLAHAGFAPALHACVPVCGDVQMVVMDRVLGKMAWCAERKQELLPRTVYDDVESAIRLLHENNLVFGDLRPPNVMCVPKSGPEGRTQMGAMLVDFDWAGEAGRTRYPVVFNDGLPDVWAPGDELCGLMYPEPAREARG
ncbi:hypothetical protein C8T65DRAFT_738835 [Cerioporus squamosus]|nr:hypothetical protein C8T65DRAFT_738835 [Cerioporus squamosus]